MLHQFLGFYSLATIYGPTMESVFVELKNVIESY